MPSTKAMGFDENVEPIYAQLRQIAPTVGVATDFTDWKRNARSLADALGRPGPVDDAIIAFERRAAQFRRRNRAILQRTTVTLLRVVPDALRIATDGNIFNGQVMAEAGVRRPANQQQADKDDIETQQIEISEERIGELNADVIINLGTGGGFEGGQSDALERFMANPLWDRLDAVRNGRVYDVNPDHWFSVGSPEAAELILDDLQRLLVEDA